MKYTFFGTPKFAEMVLQKLIKSGLKPQVVVCNPDKPVGRDQVVTPPPTKVVAAEHDILVWQPDKPTKEQFEVLKTNDLFVIAAYGKIISKDVLEIPKKGSIALHPSLLPKYRGATPIRSAILAGEEKTGVAVFEMDEKMDHGPIIAEREVEIGDMNHLELRDKLAEVGAELLAEVMPKYIEEEIEPKEQNHDKATFTKKFSSDDAFVPPEKLIKALEGGEEAVEVERKIRALNPEPGTWTKLKRPFKGLPKQKRVKLIDSEIKNGKLILTEIHIAGKTPKEVEITG